MKRKLRLIQFPLVILVSVFIPLLSSCLDYSDLADVGFPSRDRRFENPDQMDLLVAQQNEPKLVTSGFFPIALRPGIDLLELFSHFTFQRPSYNRETTILRC